MSAGSMALVDAAAWMAHRVSLSVGPLFCVIDGPTRGRRGGRRPRLGVSCASSQLRPGCVAGSRRISYAMRTRSSSPVRAWR